MAYRIKQVDPTNEGVRCLLNQLDRACFPADELCDKDGDWWIVYDGKTPVGYAGLKPSNRIVAAGYLCRVGVLPDHRGCGLQARLIRARLRAARKKGWHTVYSDTYNNLPSANNLIRAGFRLYWPEVPWSYVGALYWKKSL